MLTQDQRDLLVEGFELGLYDNLIAKRIGITLKRVYGYRKSLNITGKDLLENRLNSWMNMVRNGFSLELISLVYDVKPQSIRLMLWREKQFSFREAKQELREAFQQLGQTGPAGAGASGLKESTIKLFGLPA